MNSRQAQTALVEEAGGVDAGEALVGADLVPALYL